MGIFHVFSIVQMIPNRAKRHMVVVGQHFLESLFLQWDISQRCNFNPGISNLFFVAVPVRLYLILLDPVKYVYNTHE